MKSPAAAHSAEDCQVKEMHPAEHEKNEADFRAELLQRRLGVQSGGAVLQGQSDEADVDKVEANDQEMVHRIGQLLISVKALDKEHAAVFVESACDPHGEADADEQVCDIGGDNPVHIIPFSFVSSRQIQKSAVPEPRVPWGAAEPVSELLEEEFH